VNTENLIRQTAQESLEIESKAISALQSSINDDFVAVAKHIKNTNGRLVITGIGKSAIIAQKIVATLNSTGTPALFMHAADAVHGDLGMIQSDDIVLCISKSGNTAEIKVLIPLLKNFGNLLVGMTSNKNSYLAKSADYLLYIPVNQEADPNNLAPTASAIAQMAMGDALATALLAARGFSPQDFAQFHPGGALGKRLYLRVSDLYPLNDRPLVQESDSLSETLLEMTAKRLGCTIVVNEQNKVTGIITDGDLRRILAKGANINNLKAKDLMTPSPKMTQKNDLAVKALQIMRKHSITQVIVMENEDYLGIVHLHDLIKEGIV